MPISWTAMLSYSGRILSIEPKLWHILSLNLYLNMKKRKMNINYFCQTLPEMLISADNTNTKCRKGFRAFAEIINEFILLIKLEWRMKCLAPIQNALDKLSVMTCVPKQLQSEIKVEVGSGCINSSWPVERRRDSEDDNLWCDNMKVKY